jgi:hypothetical protein
VVEGCKPRPKGGDGSPLLDGVMAALKGNDHRERIEILDTGKCKIDQISELTPA